MASTDGPFPPPPQSLPAKYDVPGHSRPSSGGPSSHKHHHHQSKHKHHEGGDKHRSSHRSSKPPSSSKPPPPAAEPAVQSDNRLRRETPFLANIRFKNDLPEVPGDPKLLVVQHPPEKLAAFSLSSIEKEPKRDLILPPDLGVALSVLDMERFAVPKESKPALHPADLALLGADADMLMLPGGGPLTGVSKAGLGLAASPVVGPRRGTALRSAADVSWLMRTTYISADAEATRATKAHANEYEARRQKELKEQELQGGGTATEEPEEDDEEAQRQAQIRVIEATFAAARAPPVHRTKPDMHAVEVMDVLPDVDWWGYKYLVGHFDKDPVDELDELQALNDPELAHQVVGRCIFKGFQLNDQDGQAKARAGASAPKFLGLCVPSDIPQAAEMQQAAATTGLVPEDVAGEYMWVKEYAYDLDRKELGERGGAGSSTAQQTHILRFANGRALYLDPSKVLNLRRKDAGSKSKGSQLIRPSKVTLRVREPSQKEVEDANKRRRLLAVQSGHDADEEAGYGSDV